MYSLPVVSLARSLQLSLEINISYKLVSYPLADNKKLLDEVFVIPGIINLSAEPKAEADNTYRDLDYLRYNQKPNLIIVLLYIVLKKITTNTPSQGT